MYRMHLAVIATVLATLGAVECEVTQAAGKCRPICVDPVPIDFDRLGRIGKWDVLYATNIPEYLDVDEQLSDITPIVDGIFRVDHRVVFGDESNNRSTFTVSYADNVVTEDTVDEKGDRHQLRLYPLALTKENALLVYRCSNSGQDNIDTRFIAIPKGNECSKEGLQYLFAVDKKCNFKGDLKKLPKRHSKSAF